MKVEDRSFHVANKHPLGEWLIGRVLMQGALTRAFGGVYVKVDPATLRLRRRPEIPIILCATHAGWWDGHMAYILSKRVFRREPYLMMEEKQLARYLFFTWVGAFGVDRQNPRSALESIRYITPVLLERSNQALWIFPQGEMYHPDSRPIIMHGGAVNIARRLRGCVLVPVALRYDFLREQAPDAFANVGPPLWVSPANAVTGLAANLRDAMTQAADGLHDDITLHNIASYHNILSGRNSANKSWDRVRGLFGSGKKT